MARALCGRVHLPACGRERGGFVSSKTSGAGGEEMAFLEYGRAFCAGAVASFGFCMMLRCIWRLRGCCADCQRGWGFTVRGPAFSEGAAGAQ